MKKTTKTPKLHLYQRAGTKVWWFHFSYNGKLIRQTTEQEDKGKALEAAQQALRAHLAQSVGFSPSTARPVDVFAKYIELKERDGADPSTLANYRTYAQNFLAFFPGVDDLATMTRFQIEDFKVWLTAQKVRIRNGHSPTRTLSKKSVKERLVFLSAVCNEFDLHNPCKGVKLPKKTVVERQEELKFFAREQVRAFLDKALEWKTKRPAFYWWSVFLFNTGARLGEIQGLRFKDINFKDGTVFLVSDKRDEGRRIKLAPITTDDEAEITAAHNSPLYALQALTELAVAHYEAEVSGDTRLHFQGVRWYYEWFVECCKAAGVPVLSPHSTRHSYVTQALRTTNIATVAKTIGHKDLNLTYSVYGHFVPDEPPTPIAW